MLLTETPHAGEYGVIYADPPWKFKSYSSKQGVNWRAPERHYPTMDLEAIKALPVREVAARNAHLFMWTTGPFLELSLDVLRAWGFRYSTVAFAWVKLKRRHNGGPAALFYDLEDFHLGLGLTTRANVELCLLGRRGSPKRLRRDVRQLIVDPVREHSRKPDSTRDRIVAYAPGPRLEMFARQAAPGFDAWGNQVDLFPPARRPRRLARAGS